MKVSEVAHPILNCEQSRAFEASILHDQAAEWAAMQRAGDGLARMVIRDFHELRAVPEYLRVLVLVGKGHNAGDAMLACGRLLADFPRASVTLLLTSDVEGMKPLTARAYEQIYGRVAAHRLAGDATVESIRAFFDEISSGEGFDLCLDGLLGISFTPPVREPMAQLLEAVNGYDKICLRAAVDLPSGKGDTSDTLFFKPDFTYATGIPKCVEYVGSGDYGRVRFIDLGFFDGEQSVESSDYLLNAHVLDPIRKLRPANVDKRSFGHLFVLGGSAYMPGALLMAVQAAVRSGVGLVTAFAPASLASSLAAQVPEAMWVPWPETGNGTLNPRAMPLLLDRIGSATAVLVGPGMGRDRNTEMVAQEIVSKVELPVICDADALRTRVMELALKRKAHFGPVVLTPHMGEYMRIAKLNAPNDSSQALREFCKNYRVMTVLKGPVSRICDGDRVFYSTFGGPVLSRAGSGDVLSGLVGGMLAQNHTKVLDAVARGVVLHGLAAERLARKHGQVAVHTTQVLDYFCEVLRVESGACFSW